MIDTIIFIWSLVGIIYFFLFLPFVYIYGMSVRMAKGNIVAFFVYLVVFNLLKTAESMQIKQEGKNGSRVRFSHIFKRITKAFY